jgi:membrane-associated phospholipid phosphatase
MKKLILLLFLVQSIYADFIETSGDALRILIPSFAYANTFYHNDCEGKTEFYKSIATNVAITYGLKYSVKKTRPNKKNDRSFPSGHTSITFQGASFLHRRYGLEYGLLAYAGAIFTGYSRIHSDNHYIEDVLAGAVIGVLSSYTFTTASKLHFKPFFADGSYGIGIQKFW